jgi:hypothetical protein
MVDSLLVGALAFLQLVLGVMGIYVALRPPRESRHLRWILAFVAVGVTGVVLTVVLAFRSDSAQKLLNTQITGMQITQAQEEAELKTVRGIMEGFAKTGVPGLKDFAESVLKAIQAPKPALSQGSPVTDAQLCERTTTLAKKIRSFETDFSSSERAEEERTFQQMVGKTREEQFTLQQNDVQQETQRNQSHVGEFQSRFLSDVKYDHDQIIDRLPAAKRDQLTGHNGESETIISVGHLVGAETGYGVANYLDELANTLCSK